MVVPMDPSLKWDMEDSICEWLNSRRGICGGLMPFAVVLPNQPNLLTDRSTKAGAVTDLLVRVITSEY